LSFYEGTDDFLNPQEAAAARATVNGSDKATLIAGYHKHFYEALTAAGWKAKVAPKKLVDGKTAAGAGLIVALIAFWDQITSLLGF
jgi:hypothetical protein